MEDGAITGGPCGERTDSKEADQTPPSAQARSPVSGCSLRDGSARLTPHAGAREVLVLDLHVAIQDVMGWLDYHLHEFRLLDATERNVASIGIPR
jgi:hypothetical protein